MAGLTRADIRAERRRIEFTRRLAASSAITDWARIIGDYLTAAVHDRSLTDDEACALLDYLAAPVLSIIREHKECEHDHHRG